MKIIKEITINELPKWSKWPERLLGLSSWKNVNRDVSKIESEYNKDKYGKTLDFFNASRGKVTMEQLKKFEYQDFKGKVCISLSDRLLIVKAEDALKEYYEMMVDELSPLIKDGDAVLELGCGYGYNLDLLSKKIKKDVIFFGGEFSKNAVNLGNVYFKDKKPKIDLSVFNFYDKSYDILEKIDRPIVLFTAHAIEQMPDISNMFNVLLKHKAKIRTVVHFEPTFELHDDSLIGLLRKKYAEVNDYSRNLIGQLRSRSKQIKVLSIKKNVLGYNPLNVTSIVKWRFENN